MGEDARAGGDKPAERSAGGRPAGARAGDLVAVDQGRQVVTRDARGLTPMQAKFVAEMSRGAGTPTDAARRAGYAGGNAGQRAYELLHTPHIVAAIQAEQRTALTEVVGLAVKALRDVLSDESAAPRDKIAAARVVLDRTGLGPTKPQEPEKADKPLEELSIAELEARIAAAHARLITVPAERVEPPAPSPDEPERAASPAEADA